MTPSECMKALIEIIGIERVANLMAIVSSLTPAEVAQCLALLAKVEHDDPPETPDA